MIGLARPAKGSCRYKGMSVLQEPSLQICLIYAFLHSIAFWGAIYFEKLHFIKTAFFFFVSLGILILLNKTILGVMTGRKVEAVPPFG